MEFEEVLEIRNRALNQFSGPERIFVDNAFAGGPKSFINDYRLFPDEDGILHRNLIIYGPPGSGKTTLARHLISVMRTLYPSDGCCFIRSSHGLTPALATLAKLGSVAYLYALFMDDATYAPFTKEDFKNFFRIRHFLGRLQGNGLVYTIFATHELGKGLAKAFKDNWDLLLIRGIPTQEYELRQLRRFLDKETIQAFMKVKRDPSMKSFTLAMTPYGIVYPLFTDLFEIWLKNDANAAQLFEYEAKEMGQGRGFLKELLMALLVALTPYKYRRLARAISGLGK